jgi:WD40 repeat protein
VLKPEIFHGHTQAITLIKHHTSYSKELFSASLDKLIVVWDIASREKLHEFTHNPHPTLCIDFALNSSKTPRPVM